MADFSYSRITFYHLVEYDNVIAMVTVPFLVRNGMTWVYVCLCGPCTCQPVDPNWVFTCAFTLLVLNTGSLTFVLYHLTYCLSRCCRNTNSTADSFTFGLVDISVHLE